LQVHDELVYEADKSVAEKIVKKIKSIMETVIPKEKIKGIVLKADASMGENWKEMKKFI